MPYIGAKHLATKARGGLAFKSQIPVMPKHQGFYFLISPIQTITVGFGISPNQPKNGSQTITAGLGISPYPEKQARPAKGGPSMEWPQDGTPEESCPAYRGPVPIGTELPQTPKASRTKFVP